MRFVMASDEKHQCGGEDPAVIIAQPEPGSVKMSPRKKYTIIAVVGVVVVALVLTAILVGVYLFTDAQKELVQVTMSMKNGMTQDVTGDPNTNTVQFHVQEANQETWMINDYNSNLKVMKIKTATETNCFVTPLNESTPVDVPKMKSVGRPQENASSISLGYSTNGQPIKDTSFLSKTARDTCNGISTYWLYPSCDDNKKMKITSLSETTRQKRESSHWDPYWYSYCAECGDYYYCINCDFSYSCNIDIAEDHQYLFNWWC